MRSLLTIGATIVLLAITSATSYRYIQTSTQVLTLPLDSIEQSVLPQNWEKARKELDSAQTQWDKHKKLWTILLDHQEIDNVDLSIQRLEKYLKAQDVPLSLGEVSHLKLLIDHISDSSKLNISNIL